MVAFGNKFKLQKLLKAQLKAQAPTMGCKVIYCETETSTNLSSGVANADNILRPPGAGIMIISALTVKIQMCTFKQHISHNKSLVIY